MVQLLYNFPEVTVLRKILIRITGILLCLIFFVSALAATPADYSAQTPGILEQDHLYGRSCILMNADTGEVLFQKEADTRRYPASTTKIMTCLLALESELMGSYITIPNNIAVSSDSSKMGITGGDRMLFDDLLYGMMLASGNDAALAVAILVSGSAAQFVKDMNAKAAALGMNATHYTNPHGLHEVNHYSTARDIATLTAYAMKDPVFRDIVACTEHTVVSDFWPDGKVFKTKYDLLLTSSPLYYPYCIGVKTGYHSAAGRCFVGAAEKEGVTLITVSLNPVKIDEKDKTYVEAFTDTKRLSEYGFAQYTSLTFKQMCDLCEDSLLSFRVSKAAEDDINGGYLKLGITGIPADYFEGYRVSNLEDPEMLTAITKDFSGRIEVQFTNNTLTAPLTAGDVVGKAYFTGTDGIIYEGTLVASRNVEQQPPTVDEIMDEWIDNNAPWLGKLMPRRNPTAWIFYILILAVIVFLIARRRLIVRKRNKKRKAAYERRRKEYLRRMQREEYLRKHPQSKGKTTVKKPVSKK